MSQQETLQVSPEFVSGAAVISGVIADVKAGKSVEQILIDSGPLVISTLGALGNVKNDAQAPDNIAWMIRQILTAVLPPVTQS